MKKFLPLTFLTLTLVLTACDNGQTPPKPESASDLDKQVTGALAAWPYSAALLTVNLPFNDQQLTDGSYALPAGGAVNMTLPLPKATLTKTYLIGCTLSSDFQGSNVNFDIGRLLVYSKGQDYLGQIIELNGENLLLRFYSAAATTLKGTATCDQDLLNFNAAMKAGWNVLQVAQATDGSFTLTNAPADAKPTLNFMKTAERLVIQPDNTGPIVLKRGQTIDYPVTLYQDGGVAGDINFSTNVNGLEFSPRTIALPSNVGMQGLKSNKHYLLHKIQPAGQIKTQSIKTTFKLTARDHTSSYKGRLQITASRANGAIIGEYLHSGVEVLVPQLSADIYPLVAPQGKTTDWKFNLYPQDYRGSITLTLEGLPSGLNVPSQTLQITDANSKQVAFSLKLNEAVAIGNWPVTLVMKQDVDGYVIQRSTVLTVMPKPITLVQANSGMTASADGNLWYASAQGVIRQRPDGTYDAFSDPGNRCGDFLLGQDQGIWETSAPLVRFAPDTGSAQLLSDPRGRSGCGSGSGFYVDSKSRGWDRYMGIQRLDYANQKTDNILGSDNDALLDVDKTQVWAYTTTNGQQQLVSINGDTLVREVKTISGINTLFPAYARNGKIWFPKSVPYHLAVYDPATEQVKQIDVIVDGKTITAFDVIGVDAQGRHWLEISTTEGERTFKDWILYDPNTQTVVKRHPAIFATGNGQLKAVSPDGTLWVRTSDPLMYTNIAYVIKP